ncbi:MAG: hypothetical protein M1814_001293 [Vezdaea aestivalis]|nr:MAG: hypothetical protein M1814_001293 [Vezdaea aestivalis]
MLSQKESLAIAELVFYIPALFISIYVSIRHGFGRARGWLFLIILSVLRISGGGVTIALSMHYNRTLYGWAAALSSVGLSALLLAQHGILSRCFEVMPPNKALSSRIVRLLVLLPLVGLILSIVGATKFSTDLAESHTLLKAASVIYLVVWLIQATLCAFLIIFLRYIPHGEHILVYAVTAAVPFLFIRCLYSILSTFVTSTNIFGLFDGRVDILAGMAIAMEFIIVTVFLGAGIMAPVIPRSATLLGNKRQQLDYDESHLSPQESGHVEKGPDAVEAPGHTYS